MKLDDETKKQVSDAERIQQTMNTPGWEIIESKLDEMIKEVSDIRSLPDGTAEERIKELDKRTDAVALLEHWLANIKGDVINNSSFTKEIDEEGENIIINKN